MTSERLEPDLFAAIEAAASGVAKALRKDPASAVLFWGDPPEVEVIHQAGLPDDVARALSAGGGAHVADAVRRAGKPLRVRTDVLPDAADSLAAALRAHEVVALALFPLHGETGIVGCLLVPMESETELRDAQRGWEVGCRALAGMQVAAGAAALAAILAEDRRRPLGLCDGVVVVDRWERVLLTDGVVRELPGWNRADPFGRSLHQLLGGDLLSALKVSRRGALEGEEHVFPPAESHGIPVSIAALPIGLLGEGLDGSRVLLFRDLRTEEGRRMDSTSRILALGLRVAHAADEFLRVGGDAGGPAGVGTGLLQALQRRAGDTPELVRRVLESTVDEADRGLVDLNEALSQVLERVRGELEMERVRVFSFLRPDLDPVPGDALELLGALRTLVSRARESLRSAGGTLTVRTWVEEGWVCAAVSDDGAGAAPAGHDRAFEPLFEEGIGARERDLKEVEALAVRCGGRLQVERRPRVWNRYTLMLPMERRKQPAEKGTSETRVQRDADGALQVLVVDDNAALRSVLRRFLERRGHSVTEAVDGDDALGIVSGGSFDRVIVDIQMPGKTGPEFYSCLARVAPHMQERTLFMTGGILEDTVEEFLTASGRPAISKPFDLAELARTVEG